MFLNFPDGKRRHIKQCGSVVKDWLPSHLKSVLRGVLVSANLRGVFVFTTMYKSVRFVVSWHGLLVKSSSRDLGRITYPTMPAWKRTNSGGSLLDTWLLYMCALQSKRKLLCCYGVNGNFLDISDQPSCQIIGRPSTHNGKRRCLMPLFDTRTLKIGTDLSVFCKVCKSLSQRCRVLAGGGKQNELWIHTTGVFKVSGLRSSALYFPVPLSD